MHKRTRNVLLSFVAVVLMALGIYLFIAVTSPASTTPQTTSVPVAGAEQYTVSTGIVLPLTQLEGKWILKNDNATFLAEVKGRNIKIDIVTPDASMAYWNGTFETAESPGKTITSTVNENEVVFNASKSKDFEIGEDTISFQFKAMGVTKKVVLNRG